MFRVVPGIAAAAAVASISSFAHAGTITVDFTQDAGGRNTAPLNGLSGRAMFMTTGDRLRIKLTNTSTDFPAGTGSASSLLTTIGFNLPSGVNIVTGDSASIAMDSTGVGGLSSRGGGSFVNDQWGWTNAFGGDLLNQNASNASRQLVTAMQGNGGGSTVRFDGQSGTLAGPSGGLQAVGSSVSLGGQSAVRSTVVINMTLNRALTDGELMTLANGGVIEFGSDFRYLSVFEPIPAPATSALGALGLGLLARRRR